MQAALFLTFWFVVKVSKNPFTNPATPEEVTETVYYERVFRYASMITHFVIFVVQIWHQRVSEASRNITTILIILAMFMQIMLSISAI